MAKKETFVPFFVTARIVLKELISEIGSEPGQTISGYFINIGVKAHDKDEARQLVDEYIKDGTPDWPESSWRPIDELHADIRAKAGSAHEAGVWYHSGRVFF